MIGTGATSTPGGSATSSGTVSGTGGRLAGACRFTTWVQCRCVTVFVSTTGLWSAGDRRALQ